MVNEEVLLVLPIILVLFLPTIKVYSWALPPYAVTQIINLETIIMWTTVGQDTDFYAIDWNLDGVVTHFEYISTVYSSDGSYMDFKYVEVDLL